MRFQQFRGLPRTRTGLALFATGLYAFLAFFVLYVPIGVRAPLVLMFGSQDTVRQMARTFVHGLFWPLVAILAITAIQALIEYSRNKRA